MRSYLDFEKPVAELEAKVEELRAMGETGNAVAIGEEINRLESKAALALKELYAELTPWQKTQVARHPQRPHCLDYIAGLVSNFIPLAGDRKFGDDAAIVGGFGRFRGESVCVIGHEKGSDTESRLKHNFGMARPEGYRKAVRLMEMADRFGLPVISLVDTAGAYPGIGAEERGQAEAIARSTETCLS
ncbi:MAG: carboxyl transferase domain-containing protein, partial [Pseudolabrys sp.]